jgi:hypothetical protein
MKQKEVFNKIGGIIQELNDQYEYLKTVTEDLNDLELELFVSNAHFLTDHVEILRKLNLQNSKFKNLPVEKPPIEKPAVEKTETLYEHKYFEPVVQQMKFDNEAVEERYVKPPFKPIEVQVINYPDKEEKTAPLVYMDPDDQQGTNSHLYNEPETIRHELILDEDQNWEDDDENIADENITVEGEGSEKTNIAPSPEINNTVETTETGHVKYEQGPVPPVTIAGEEVLTVNQKISSQLGEKAMGRTDELNLKPISDIKLAITLNDKLLYVKDLFNGYNLAYSEAIEILNRFNTFDEAMRFLNTNYVAKNNWDSKPATTEKFYELLKRRYA